MPERIVKDFPVWKTITVGTLSHEELISRILGEKRVDLSTQIILDKGIEIASQPCEYDIVLADTNELGVPRGEGNMQLMVRFAAIEETILGYGYERLTPEMVLQLRLVHPHEEWISYYLFPLMKPLQDEDGDPVLLAIHDYPYDEETAHSPLSRSFFGSWVKAHILMCMELAGRSMADPVAYFREGKIKQMSLPTESWFPHSTNWLFVKPRPR